jgi:hypothetical protein
LLLHGEGPADMRTRGMGKRMTISHVNLSALFTSAPDWFMTTIPEEAFGGGLMSRFLVCCLEDREVYDIDIQADDKHGVDVIERLVQELEPVSSVMSGHIVGTDDAQEWIKAWYMHNETEALADERFAPHRNRKPANLLRLAMILGASRGEGVLTCTLLKQAAALLDWMEPTLTKMYGLKSDTVTTMEKGERRILTKLQGVDSLPHSDLARACSSYFRGGTREMRRCLEGLVEKGLIQPIWRNGVAHYPPKTWKANAMEDVIVPGRRDCPGSE